MEAFWIDLERRFLELHQQQVQERRNGFVYADYSSERWTVGGGNRNSKKQFEWLAKRAALRRGCPSGLDPVIFWLDLLRQDSPRYQQLSTKSVRRKSELDSDEICSIEYETGHSDGGRIEGLCKASAEYCIECDTEEAATAVERQIFVAENSGKTAQAESRSNKHSKPLDDREQKIWDVIRRGARGIAYCRELDAAKVSPPRKGIWKEGPRTYVASYQSDKRLVHWIQNEKAKIRRKAELAGHTETRTKLARE